VLIEKTLHTTAFRCGFMRTSYASCVEGACDAGKVDAQEGGGAVCQVVT
jgi:hypothetical protein